MQWIPHYVHFGVLTHNKLRILRSKNGLRVGLISERYISHSLNIRLTLGWLETLVQVLTLGLIPLRHVLILGLTLRYILILGLTLRYILSLGLTLRNVLSRRYVLSLRLPPRQKLGTLRLPPRR